MNKANKVLECINLSIGYRVGDHFRMVMSDINAIFQKGDLVALAGVNGAGKSTLLKTIAGLLKPLGGEVLLFGKNIAQYSHHELARLVSLVLTDQPEEFYLTVFDTVATGRSPYTGFWGRLSKTDRIAIDQSLEYAGVQHLKYRLLNSLSDGERQKVMIAKALAQNTPVIILDEPAAFLDFPSKIELMNLLQRLATKHRKTIIFSSHDLDLIIRTVDNVWLIGNGAPIAQGTPEILLKNNAFANSFGNQRLKFNHTMGHFQVHKQIRGTYHFIREDADQSLIASALQRRGFIPSSGFEADVVINHGPEGTTITFQGKTFNFDTFERLIHGIQHL